MSFNPVDIAKKKLQDNAFKNTKAFLTGINEDINRSVVGSNSENDIGSVYQKKSGKSTNKPEKKSLGSFQNKEPVLFGGYGMSINGKELGVERLAFITSLTINQNEGTSSSCEFTVSDPNFYFIEDSIFIRETPIQASISLLGDMKRKVYFDGYIAAIDIDFPSDGCPTLNVHCIDKTHEMTRVKYKRSWENVTSSQVVQQIAQEQGYSVYVEPDYPFPIQATIIQDDKTNIEFLEDLAKKELDLFECHLVTNDDGKTTIYYVIAGKMDKEKYTELAYRTTNLDGKEEKPLEKQAYFDIISFKPSINIETREEETKSDGINHDTKAIENASIPVEEPNDTKDSSGSPSSSNDSEEREVIGYK